MDPPKRPVLSGGLFVLLLLISVLQIGSLWVWFIPHHRLLAGVAPSSPRTQSRGAVTSEHATQRQPCLGTAGSKRELITYIPQGWSVAPKTSSGNTHAAEELGKPQRGEGVKEGQCNLPSPRYGSGWSPSCTPMGSGRHFQTKGSK